MNEINVFPKKQKRLSEIDCLKGIGILIVILQHCVGASSGESNIISLVILAFHMPLFFWISGFVYKRKKDVDFFAGKVASLLAPVLLYNCFNVMIYCFLMLINKEKYYSVVSFSGFWFLESLFYIVVMHYVIEGYIEKYIKTPWHRNLMYLLIAMLVLSMGLFLSRAVVGTETTMATVFVGYAYYLMGVLSKKVNDYYHLSKYTRVLRGVFILGGLTFIVALCGMSKKNVPVLMFINNYGNSGWFFINSVLGILGVFLISKGICKCKLLEFWGRNSLIVLITHFPIYKIAMKILLRTNMIWWLAAMLGFLAVCLVEFVLVNLVNKYMPVFFGKIQLKK